VWIKAKNMIGTSGFSPSANAKPSAFAVAPETPKVPSVTTGNRELIINWQQAEGALFYEVWTGLTNNPSNVEKHGGDISGISATLTGLVNGTTYYIWIKAKNNIGASGFSPVASGTPSASAASPSAPQSAPAVTAGSGQLTISWQAAEGASAYEVWAGTANNSETATKRGGDVSGLSSVITGLTNGTVYYVWIKAKNAAGTSGFSPMASGTPQEINVSGKIPTAPIVNTGNEQITLTWEAVEGATAYEVWMGTVNNSASASKNGADISESLSVSIDGLTNGTTYYIWLKAKNIISVSEFSPVASGKPIANAAAPTLSAGNGQLSVTWTAIAGADQYEVFYGTGVNPPQTAVQTVTSTSATISGLVNGTTYNVWVRGKNSTGTGAISSFASAKPVGNMGTVTLVSGNSQIAISWSQVDGADQYEVYYNTSNSIPGSPAQTVATNTATISGLTNGTTYYVWVKGKNANGTGNACTAVSGKPLGTPGAPTLSPAYKYLQVTWTAVSGADEYEVYYGIGSPTTLATTTTGTTATIGGLTVGTTYYVRLRAKNANGVSDFGLSASGVSNSDIPMPGLYRGMEKIGDQDIAASLTYISTNAVTGDDFYIVLGEDESFSPTTLDYSGKAVSITMLGYGSERKITLKANGSLFTVSSGVTLTLDKNIKLVGLLSNTSSLVYIYKNGNLIINDGGKIYGNGSSSGYGGGISCYSGTITMNGGEITGNSANFSSSWSHGGGIYINGGTFTMNGGLISSNTVSSNIYGSWGGGVCIDDEGTFTMSGGEISSNNVSGSKESCGGGVYCYGSFTMSGGKISGNTNTATGSSASGGGVYFIGITLTMSGGEISGNTVSNTFNDASAHALGGGVYFDGRTFTMSGGEISGNKVSGSQASGGGVYILTYGSYTFTKTGGGTITGYASDTVKGNVVRNRTNVVQSNQGHAVCIGPAKRRETTAGPGVNLDSSKSGTAGGWE
jgi:hypothetical protein